MIIKTMTTSDALTHWGKVFLIDAILIATAYFWLAKGIEGAGNVFLLFAWFLALQKLSIGTTQDHTWFDKHPASLGTRTHSAIARLAIICVLVWTGSFWTLAITLIGILFYEAAKTKEPKAAAAQPKGSGE